MRETRFWWIRHAPVPDGGRIYGQRDLPCDCSDRETFAALARVLPRGAVWATSNLLRAKQTAQAIWEAGYGFPEAIELADLAEQHLGDWQGLDRAEFYAARPQRVIAHWFAEPHERAPGGESFNDMAARTRTGVDKLLKQHGGGDIVVVAHGGVIRAAIGIALDLPPHKMLAFATDNCALTRLDHIETASESGWRVAFINWRMRSGESGPLA
ncbi:MAG: histidine phosphatase family protein [Hyphomicrobiales bacterium]|nr:histidine phosphatase family protein [Hyphomicrobiales bacterium]